MKGFEYLNIENISEIANKIVGISIHESDLRTVGDSLFDITLELSDGAFFGKRYPSREYAFEVYGKIYNDLKSIKE